VAMELEPENTKRVSSCSCWETDS